jgi:hypothetical protein
VAADDGTEQSVEVTDATGFGSSGKATWGSEVVTWTGKSGNTLTPLVRGVDSTQPIGHPAGDLIVEVIDDAIFGVADHEVSAIGDVYAHNPFNNEIVKLSTTFTKNTADTIESETRATLEFTDEQLKDTLIELAMSPVDPDFTPPTPAPINQRIYAYANVDADGNDQTRFAMVDNYTGYGHDLDPNESAAFRFFRPSGGFDVGQKLYVRMTVQSGSGTVAVYAGRWGVGSTTLMDTWTVTGGPTVYNTTTTLDTEWVSIVVSAGLYVRVHEVYMDIGNVRSMTQQSASHGKLNGGSEVSSGNWFDDNDGTYVDLPGWAGCKFADQTFDVQFIKIRIMHGSSGEFSVKVGNDYDSGTALFAGTQYEPGFFGTVTYQFCTNLQGNYITVDDGSSGGTLDLYELSRWYVTYADPPAVADPEVAGASIGYGLRLFADVDGYEVPSGASPAYKAGAAGTLMKKPCDILRYIIEELGGETIDTTSYDACNTNLGATEIACDLRTMGGTWEEMAARVAFESRVTLVPEETSSGILTPSPRPRAPSPNGSAAGSLRWAARCTMSLRHASPTSMRPTGRGATARKPTPRSSSRTRTTMTSTRCRATPISLPRWTTTAASTRSHSPSARSTTRPARSRSGPTTRTN